MSTELSRNLRVSCRIAQIAIIGIALWILYQALAGEAGRAGIEAAFSGLGYALRQSATAEAGEARGLALIATGAALVPLAVLYAAFRLLGRLAGPDPVSPSSARWTRALGLFIALSGLFALGVPAVLRAIMTDGASLAMPLFAAAPELAIGREILLGLLVALVGHALARGAAAEAENRQFV
ncbi:MAG: hypothetical protein AAGI03_15520 [Pseudomonadota bacterium]